MLAFSLMLIIDDSLILSAPEMFSLSLLKAASGKDELELGFLALGVLCIRLSICFWMFEFGESLN